jgi:hypothetical protein
MGAAPAYKQRRVSDLLRKVIAMKTGRIALALGLGVPGVALVIGFGCSAGGDQPARPRTNTEAGPGAGGGAGAAGDTGAGGTSDSGSDDGSQGGGGTSGETGGYNPYGSGGQSGGGQSGGGTGAGGATGTGGTTCSAPNTAALKVNGPDVWKGSSTSVDNTSNVGYWYSYYDGSSGLAVLPSNTSFGTGVVNGFIEASGLGTVTSWGGGVAVSFFNSDPLTPADLSPYKGIVFQFKNSVDYGAHFAINTWDFDPKFCVCSQSSSCFNNYGVDLPKATVADTITSYWMCWPGLTCTGPSPDASADFPNLKQITLTSNVSGTVPFAPKKVTGLAFTSQYKTQWDFKLGKIRLF